MAGNDLALDTTNTDNDLDMMNPAAERKLHWMAKVHDFLEMWHGSQNLHATQKECRAKHTEMTAVGYISGTEEIINVSWSNFQHDGMAAFELLERSPLPPALSAKDLPGGRTQMVNILSIRGINQDPGESDEDSAPKSILDTKNLLHWDGDLDNPMNTEDDWEANTESDIELDKGNNDPETPELQDVNARPIVPGLIQPTQRSKKTAETVLMMVSTMEMRRNMGNKKK